MLFRFVVPLLSKGTTWFGPKRLFIWEREWMRLLFMMITLAGVAYGVLFIANQQGQLPTAVRGIISNVPGLGGGSSKFQKMYRWRDSNGSLVISDQPPPDGVTAEIMEYQNALAISVAPSRGAKQKPADSTRLIDSPLSVYSVDGMKKLQATVKETTKKLEDRAKALERLEKKL
ncbi:MAG: DUF4124 domain-containing protein [Chromatiales bacterium]|jgi:hypothetical protein|nr:DUF4124 domain-containing protein [Chromatiales bacterium]